MVKKRYKKKLLHRLIIEDDTGGSLMTCFKTINMKVVAEMVAEAWDKVKQDTLRKSWQKSYSMYSHRSSNPISRGSGI